MAGHVVDADDCAAGPAHDVMLAVARPGLVPGRAPGRAKPIGVGHSSEATGRTAGRARAVPAILVRWALMNRLRANRWRANS